MQRPVLPLKVFTGCFSFMHRDLFARTEFFIQIMRRNNKRSVKNLGCKQDIKMQKIHLRIKVKNKGIVSDAGAFIQSLQSVVKHLLDMLTNCDRKLIMDQCHTNYRFA